MGFYKEYVRVQVSSQKKVRINLRNQKFVVVLKGWRKVSQKSAPI